MKRISCLMLSLFLTLFLAALPAFAEPPVWPSDTGVQSEAGIVIDMDSGAVLFGQNIHEKKSPASITKLLTALVVIEHTSNLEDTVTISRNAMYSVDSDSGSKLDLAEGDTLTVRECLYVLLLQSSNQVANALAEYVAGDIGSFVEMMNQKTRELGCQESNFVNPSGLTDENQYTSAYDMALISRAAFYNDTLLEISSTKKSSIPPTINNPEGRTFSIEHKMLLENDENYYSDAIAGKTGYTYAAGQTLVTYARREDRRQIAVTLRSTDRTHYSDTKTILDFGFARFKNMNISENETAYVTGQEPVVLNGESYAPEELMLDANAVITLPNDAAFTDAQKELVTELPENSPEGAVARLVYTYNGRMIGQAFLYTNRIEHTATDSNAAAATPSQEEAATSSQAKPASGGTGSFKLPKTAILIGAGAFAAVVLLAVWIVMLKKRRERERERRRILREKRLQRLSDIGYTEEDFERILREHRSGRSDQ